MRAMRMVKFYRSIYANGNFRSLDAIGCFPSEKPAGYFPVVSLDDIIRINGAVCCP